jgi:hypothetical protein
LRIPRQDLRQLLLDRLAPGTVQWGQKCEGMCEYSTTESTDGNSGNAGSGRCSGDIDGGYVEVWFASGVRVKADLVVGADGLRSRVRDLRDQMIGSSSNTASLAPSVSSSPPAAASSLSSPALAVTSTVADSTTPNSTSSRPTEYPYQHMRSIPKSVKSVSNNQIEYIGVSVILGISSYKHPLLAQQGFYVLDGTHRYD